MVEEILSMNEGQLLLIWPGQVRRKREGDFGQIGPALLAGTNNFPSFINKISSTSYSKICSIKGCKASQLANFSQQSVLVTYFA